MSQENVEVVRRSFEVWNAGDMDALREMQDPGIIWRGPEGWPEPGPYAGREAVMRQVNQLASISPELGKAAAPHAERLARLSLRSIACSRHFCLSRNGGARRSTPQTLAARPWR